MHNLDKESAFFHSSLIRCSKQLTKSTQPSRAIPSSITINRLIKVMHTYVQNARSFSSSSNPHKKKSAFGNESLCRLTDYAMTCATSDQVLHNSRNFVMRPPCCAKLQALSFCIRSFECMHKTCYKFHGIVHEDWKKLTLT